MIPGTKLEVVVTLVDPVAFHVRVDTSKVSLNLAIAMLHQALKDVETEKANQAAVLFGQRLMKEQAENGIADAVARGRKFQ